MNIKRPLLSICIPTYNRAKILKGSLSRLRLLFEDVDMSEVEILISDNCSPDNTKDVVNEFIRSGLKVSYKRNEENIGAARNFLNCMNWASGKYIMLLGDDDYLIDGSIKYLLDVLRNKDYGLVYIDSKSKDILPVQEYFDKNQFIKNVSYWFTFMSGNIYRKDIVPQIKEPLRYVPSHLLQLPFYIKSVCTYQVNAIVSEPIIDIGQASNTNGGYNFFDVFVHWYLEIMQEYMGECEQISKSTYTYVKWDIFENFIKKYYLKRLLIKGDKGNFQIENGWRILFKYYGNEWYFHKYLIKYPFGVIKRKIKKYLLS